MQRAKVVDQPAVITMPWRDLLLVLLVGAIVGLATLGLYALFDKYVFTPTLCGDSVANIGKCENKDILSAGFATVLAGLLGLFLVVRQRVYRPLFVVLLATAVLWNLVLFIGDMSWVAAAALIAAIGAFAYGAFAWIATLRNFAVSAILGLVLVVVVRLVLS